MSTRYEINLATPADDDQLRAVLASTPMRGDISLAFAREPSYFAAAQVDGREVQVGVARDMQSGRVVGMGSRAIGARYVNDEQVNIGYLSGLRIVPELRGRVGLLARAYRFLRERHRDGRVPYYLTTIAADNTAALELLGSGRAGLPVYHDWGLYHTMAISTRSAKARAPDTTLTVRQAQREERDTIARFLNQHGRSRQFFPVYDACDLFSDRGILRGIAPDDLLMALHGGAIIGTLATWDQRPFKQTLVHGYPNWLRVVRPLYNAWAGVAHRPMLPPAGGVVDAQLAALTVVAGDDLEVFAQLLQSALHRVASQGCRMLLVGLHERDPLLPIVRRLAGRQYVTRMYVVYWPDEVPRTERLRERIPYLELGCL